MLEDNLALLAAAAALFLDAAVEALAGDWRWEGIDEAAEEIEEERPCRDVPVPEETP